MRIALAALLLFGSGMARAADDVPPPPHRHRASWYSGWTLIVAGGTSTLLGAAFTTSEDTAKSTTGWVLAGVGTLTWVGGAVILKLSERAKR
jgi:hypothetical protein